MNKIFDTLVIGGGQAGLATGYHLKKNKLRFLILEASKESTGSWPHYYDSLKLFSPTRLSTLPGMKFPGNPDHYPTRNEVIRYLQNYMNHFQLPLETNQRVESVEKDGELFWVRTTSGNLFHSKTIVNATGSFHNPFKPNIQGQDLFKGNIIHSSDYRNPDRFTNQRVLVVGSGNSAVQIAVELAKISRTSLVVRQPVQFMNQRFWGQDIHFWIRVSGFDTFPFWRIGKKVPSTNSVSDPGHYKKLLASGNPNQLPIFSSFYSEGVIWQDGTKELIDTVIFATGYRPNLSFLQSMGALDHEGRPLQTAGISQTVTGLYYVGLEGQRSFASATLRGVGSDAKFVIRKLLRQLM